MVKNKILILVSLILSACACSKIVGEDEMILLERVDNTSSALRLDGYYFNEIGSDNPTIITYFFYRNGIVLYGGGRTKSEFSSLEEEYRNGAFYEAIKESKTWWGVYQIEGNEIRFERWYPGHRPYSTFLNSGEVINDTTFLVTSSSESDGSEEVERDELFKFKQFSPKPDSTNTFID